jgi:hypothetical protein
VIAIYYLISATYRMTFAQLKCRGYPQFPAFFQHSPYKSPYSGYSLNTPRKIGCLTSGKVRKQVLRGHRKRLCQLDDILQSHVSFPSLDAADVIAVQVGSLRQLLLRITPLFAEPPYSSAEPGFDSTRSHPSMLEG